MTKSFEQTKPPPPISTAHTIRQLATRARDELLPLLEEMVQQNSGSYNPRGSESVLDLIRPKMEALGFIGSRSRRTRPDWPEPYAHDVYTSQRTQQSSLTVLHIGHVDTVFPIDHPFQTLTVSGERWHGPGVADMKGGLVVLLGLQSVLSTLGLSQQIHQRIVINSDEEVQSLSSKDLIEREARGCDAVLVYEPGRDKGGIVSGRKGIARYRFDVRGRAAHAGNHHKDGRSAILAAAKMVQQIEALTNYGRGITYNVGLIEGGSSRNTVPEHCWFELDVRLVQAKDEALIDPALRQIAKGQCEEGVDVQVSGGVGRPPWSPLGEDLPLMQSVRRAAQEMQIDVPVLNVGGGSDGNFTAAMGIPTLDGFGAVGGGYHSTDEWMDTNSICDRITLLTLTLQALLSNVKRNV